MMFRLAKPGPLHLLTCSVMAAGVRKCGLWASIVIQEEWDLQFSCGAGSAANEAILIFPGATTAAFEVDGLSGVVSSIRTTSVSSVSMCGGETGGGSSYLESGGGWMKEETTWGGGEENGTENKVKNTGVYEYWFKTYLLPQEALLSPP